MKNIFVVPFHSFSDIITNSSTDIFACKTEKTVKELEEILFELYNTGETPLNNKEFKKRIAKVKLTTLKKFFIASSSWLTNYNSTTRKHIETPQYESAQDFCNQHFDGVSPDTEVLMIEGVEDNSIPYWIQGFIMDTFSSYRIHCG